MHYEDYRKVNRLFIEVGNGKLKVRNVDGKLEILNNVGLTNPYHTNLLENYLKFQKKHTFKCMIGRTTHNLIHPIDTIREMKGLLKLISLSEKKK